MTPDLDRIIKALEALFSDGGIHPVVFRQAMPGNTLSEPMVEPGLQKCRKCVEALFEVGEAYFAYKVAQPCECKPPAGVESPYFICVHGVRGPQGVQGPHEATKR